MKHPPMKAEFAVSRPSQSPNHSVTPPLLGSGFCLCFSSSMNCSCISSMDPSAAFRSFSGKMSGKVNVWFWAWYAGVKKGENEERKSSCYNLITRRIRGLFFKWFNKIKWFTGPINNLHFPFFLQICEILKWNSGHFFHPYSSFSYTNALFSLWHSVSPTHSHIWSLISLHFSGPDLFRGKRWYPLFIPYQPISGHG